MIDFSTPTEIVARLPLVLLLGIFVLGEAVTHFLFKKYPIGRAVIRVIFLILLTIALLYRDIVPYRPLELTKTPFLDAVHVVLKIAWWLYAAWFLVGELPTPGAHPLSKAAPGESRPAITRFSARCGSPAFSCQTCSQQSPVKALIAVLSLQSANRTSAIGGSTRDHGVPGVPGRA